MTKVEYIYQCNLTSRKLWDNLITHPSKQHDAPYPHTPPQFGTKQQFAEYDSSTPVGAAGQNTSRKLLENFSGMPEVLMAHC